MLASLRDDRIWLNTVDNFNDPFECPLVFLEYATLKRAFDIWRTFVESLRDAGDHGIALAQSAIGQLRGREDPRPTAIFEQAHDWYVEVDTFFGGDEDLYQIFLNDERFAGYIEQVKQWKSAIQAMFRLCCFSEEGDPCLMWSHYADNHKGICIEYDFKAAPADITTFFYPALYSDEMFHPRMTDTPKYAQMIVARKRIGNQVDLRVGNGISILYYFFPSVWYPMR